VVSRQLESPRSTRHSRAILGTRQSSTMAKLHTTPKAGPLQGTLDMLILQTLQRRPEHGHGIGLSIREKSGEILTIEAGSLYPALHRLERQGLIASEWDVSENKQRAKYYRLTAAGRK